MKDSIEEKNIALHSRVEELEKENLTCKQTLKKLKDIVHQDLLYYNSKESEHMNKASERFARFNEYFEDFSRSMDTIKRIMLDLEMLGVNATIQAAHAGEKGKGFLIVADEINKLSVNSKKNLDELRHSLKTFEELLENLDGDLNTLDKTSKERLDVLDDANKMIDKNLSHLEKGKN